MEGKVATSVMNTEEKVAAQYFFSDGKGLSLK